MWDIAISKSYKSGTQKVRKDVKRLMTKVEKDYGIKGSWSDPDNFVAEKGGHVEEGELKISSKKVALNIRFDLLGKLAKSKIQKAIEDELDKIL